MNANQRLEQARKEYDEFLAKLFKFKLPERMSVAEQWELSLAILKLKRTLDPDLKKKMLMTAYSGKVKL